jgi:hypothetical protein
MTRRHESARQGNEATQPPVVGIQDNLLATLRASIKHLEERSMNGNGVLHGANGTSTSTPAPLAVPTPSRLGTATTDTGNGSTPDVYRAICQVAKVISRDGIAKGRRNEQQGYGFRGIDDVMNALSALLAGADLLILPRMRSRTQEERTTAAGKALFYVTVRACFDFVSARDGSIHTVIMYGEAMDSADKATNKAMSAAYKYACLQVFCIPTEAMGDADQTTHEPAPLVIPPETPRYVPDRKVKDVAFEEFERQATKLRTGADFKRAFASVREPLGETQFMDRLAPYGVTGFGAADVPVHKFRNTAEARQCFVEMLAELRKVLA